MIVSLMENPNKDARARWVEFLAEVPQVSVYQSPDMLELYQRSEGFRPALALATQDDRVVGVALGVIQREIVRWYGGLSSRLLVRDGPICNRDSAAVALILRLEKWARRHAPSSVTSCQSEIAGLAGHRSEPHLNFIIDLSAGSEALWKQLHSRCRNKIRRSRRSDLVIRYELQFDVDAHYEVLRATYERAGLPLFHQALFASAWEVLGERGMLHVFGGYCADRLVGTRLVLSYRSAIYDWFAGSFAEFHDRNVNDALVWAVLEWASRAGFKTFDFGGAGHPDRPYGVREFKRKFGGEMVTGVVYRRSLWPGARIAVRSGRALYAVLRETLRRGANVS